MKSRLELAPSVHPTLCPKLTAVAQYPSLLHVSSVSNSWVTIVAAGGSGMTAPPISSPISRVPAFRCAAEMTSP